MICTCLKTSVPVYGVHFGCPVHDPVMRNVPELENAIDELKEKLKTIHMQKLKLNEDPHFKSRNETLRQDAVAGPGRGEAAEKMDEQQQVRSEYALKEPDEKSPQSAAPGQGIPDGRPPTKGETRIRGRNHKISFIRTHQNMFVFHIDELESGRAFSPDPEYQRLISEAQTKVEAASDALLKALTYGLPE